MLWPHYVENVAQKRREKFLPENQSEEMAGTRFATYVSNSTLCKPIQTCKIFIKRLTK
jgi:hypothetical protein